MTTPSWTLDASRLEQVACPACGCLEFECLARTDRHDMGLTTVGCLGCGLVMTNPQPTLEALDTFYRRHYRSHYRHDPDPSAQTIRAQGIDRRTAATVDFLIGHGVLQAGMVVMDIGASEGAMLKAVADRQPDTRRIAIEPDAVFGRHAARHAACEWHAGLRTLRESQPPPVDLVILNHVLEHLKDPVQVLASLRPLLSSRARVYVDVPDLLAYRKLNMLHIAHLYHFGPDTLARTAARAGYAVQRLEKHAPVRHPLSLRCLLVPDPGVAVGQLVNRREGWAGVTACTRGAWFAHAKRRLRISLEPLRQRVRSGVRSR